MVIGMSVLAFVAYMQVLTPSEPIMPSTLPSITSPQPVADASSTTAPSPVPEVRTQANAGPTVRAATKDEIAADARVATDAAQPEAMTNIANASIEITKGGLNMGDWMLTRDPNRIMDYKPVQDMNDALRAAGLVVWIISLGLVIMKHVLGPFSGTEPAALLYALPTTIAMGFAGYFNRPLLRLIVNMVHALLGVIVNTSLKAAIEPNLSIAGFATDVVQQAAGMLAAPFVAAAIAIVGLLLILKMWAQLGWLFILTAVAPIYVSATGAPVIGKYTSAWWRSWLGTLIDPILTLAGLKIAAAGLGFFDGEAPLLWKQLYSLTILLPLLATPGWHAGAYGGQGVDALVGLALFRLTRGMGNRNTALPPPAPTPSMIPNPAAVSGYGVRGGSGTGGGTAAAWWKTGRWTPGGWSPA